MKLHVLSLWRPWPATFFQKIANPKRIENRSKKPPVNVLGTWVVFHAGKRFDTARLPLILSNAPEISSRNEDHPTGLIGLAYIRDWTNDPGDLPRDQERWWLGPYAYEVAYVIPFAEPIPHKGQQGWKFLSEKLSGEIASRYLPWTVR